MELIQVIIGLLTLSCEGAAFLVSGSLDGRPTRSERFAMRLHLLCCPGCRRFDRQMTFLRRVMTRLRMRAKDEDAPPALMLPPDVRERIKLVLKEASNPPSPSLPGGMLDRRGSID
jgi:predicted anti-sigma-YlaC factor YlaD